MGVCFNPPMTSPLNRRQFLARTTATAAGVFLAAPYILRGQSKLAANDRLNIGFIGTAGQAGFSIDSLKDHNLVALCDVDETKLNAAGQRFPGAKKHRDFRRLIDQQGIDAIVVATPDHTHAVASIAALQSGRHLYCEKPLTRTVSEARIVTETARRLQRVTQIGTQIHAGGNYRRVVELVKSDAVGDIKEVHVWVNSSYGGKDKPKSGLEIPKNLDWDLWLGPVPKQDYSPDFEIGRASCRERV